MPGTRPASTYRLQIRPSFTLDDAVALRGYLSSLGVDWVYLSPLLTAAAGSDHGYDVVDPTSVDPARGGKAALERASRGFHDAGLGILVDIVPNHVGVARADENPWWWDLLTHGRGSRWAAAFDIDWDFGGGKVRLPVLGEDIEQAATTGALRVDSGELRYYEHRFPLAPGSAPSEHEDVLAVHARQHYELMSWRREAYDLNYRRFFGVSSLAAVRVEDPVVFEASHGEIGRWFADGIVDGLRVDHPDGLQAPVEYLERLDALTGSAYVVVEKILEHGENLPQFFAADGTTGYEVLAAIDRVLIDPDGGAELDVLDARLRERSGLPSTRPWPEVIAGTKRAIGEGILRSEVRRLTRDLGAPDDAATEDAVVELLARFPVYRSYLPAGREHLDRAAAEVRAHRPDLGGALDGVLTALADPGHPAALRFQQTSGMVMAKGVEDTAFYRATRLGTLTEVGADPSVFALSVDGFHAAQAARHAAWPHAMTTLSTHDTKRGEDVRARLAVLSEIPERWGEVLYELTDAASTGHGPFDALLWQALVGAWPASRERLHAYAEKAAREAGEATTWLEPDAAFERRLHAAVDAAFDDPAVAARLESFVAEIEGAGWSNALAAKLLQLTGPGVPDVYQGSELWEQSLVDPDNRRPVDFEERRRLLERIDAGEHPIVDRTGAAKLLMTSRALRLRRDRPELFTRYTPMTVVGAAAEHAIAVDRGGAVAVATRLPVALARRGELTGSPWGDTTLLRHEGPTVDVLTGREFTGHIALAELLDVYPVALLVAGEPS
ncbi:malto-oligosyltrehalose synthase [Microbacterium sp. B35-04]|uniref:malto-oligosyltrehalose synthase n=1 Tax=unclassified Microbacterium TaxID=2609290 RepID=UPI0013CF88B1|nr:MULTISPECIES: malto-oligosyltrehalose synthase [unclassified Microbacterium]KAF2412146.1 malto-oligosyltrehalose synthase [Microbacterium sp. B35-04]KAF2419349.1 malto-oligosyltrehalose synthase [Microbacterium sp. B35-30]